MSKRIDLTGKKFNRLTVIKYDHTDKTGTAFWRCICDCKNETVVRGRELKNSGTKSCGCLKRETTSKINARNLTNEKFGRLTAIERVGTVNDGRAKWLCVCDCGKTVMASSSSLISGNTKSCGCYGIELILERNKRACGENSPSWRGGRSFGLYCKKFNLSFKQYIRNKFKNKCFVCGKTKEENGKRNLSVHHIDYNKNSICNGNEWAFVPLCSSHHSETNSNRWYWFNLLINYWLDNESIHLVNWRF